MNSKHAFGQLFTVLVQYNVLVTNLLKVKDLGSNYILYFATSSVFEFVMFIVVYEVEVYSRK